MKRISAAKAVLVMLALFLVQSLSAQNLTTTDVPRILSYQGHITNADQAVTGVHPITIRLYSDPEGKHKLWEDTYTTDVKDGIFSVLLGSQTALPSTERLDKPIWLGVSISGTDELRPLTQFTTAPYALNVPDRSITKEKLSEDLQTLMTKPIGGQEPQSGTDPWTFGGDNISSSGDEILGTLSGSTYKDWKMIVGGEDVMRFQYNSADIPSIISGSDINSITSGIVGAVIGGGGTTTLGHIIESDNGTIAGGAHSHIHENSDYSFIGSGSGLNILPNSEGSVIGGGTGLEIDTNCEYSVIVGGSENNINVGTPYSFIGGGELNHSGSPGLDVHHTTIVGGEANHVFGNYSSVVAGYGNDVWDNADYSIVAGGRSNITSADYSGIVGGYDNTINSAGTYSFLGGGQKNSVSSPYTVIAGGDTNYAGSPYGFIGGGQSNTIIDQSVGYNTISGGERNSIRDTSSSHNFIGGGEDNQVFRGLASESHHNAITGGEQNIIVEDHSFIGGGYQNRIDEEYSAIAGGDTNYAGSPYGFIGGGQSNSIVLDNASYSVIGGGKDNIVDNEYGVVGGGELNTILRSAPGGDQSRYAVIAGGKQNLIDTASPYTVIGGGLGNIIFNNSRSSAIGGGDTNLVIDNSTHSTIAGGWLNTIDAKGSSNTIGGGHCNWLYHGGPAHEGGSVLYATIGGGYQNRIWRSTSSFIGGGYINKTNIDADYGTIGGGYWNLIDSGADYSTIGGGYWNKIKSNYGAVGGGYYNLIHDNSPYSFIGGGDTNIIDGIYCTIAGGSENQIYSDRGIIGGGCYNAIDIVSLYSTIGGGCTNYVFDTAGFVGGGANNWIYGYYGTIAGGQQNRIYAFNHNTSNEGRYGTIGGGQENTITKVDQKDFVDSTYPSNYSSPEYATIGGGYLNSAQGHGSSVVGGIIDTAAGMASTVLGGIGNKAYDFQTVGGRFNRITKVLNNTGYYTGTSTMPDGDDPLFILGNGNSVNVRSNAFEVSQNGHSIVYDVNGESALPNGGFNVGGRPSIVGSTYVDNVIYAAGDVTGSAIPGTGIEVHYSFGVSTIVRNGAGDYTVTLKLNDPVLGTPINLTRASITANIVEEYSDTAISGCHFIFPSQIITDAQGNNKFRIRIRYKEGCGKEDRRFMFKVCGRP